MSTMENNFEKHVQHKMDEFRIPPSDAVWENVKIRIEKKKSRRRGFIFFLLLTFMLLSVGYLMFNSNKNLRTSETILGNNSKHKESKIPSNKTDDPSKESLKNLRTPTGNVTSLKKNKAISTQKINLQQNAKSNYIINQHTFKHSIIKKGLDKKSNNAHIDEDISTPVISGVQPDLQKELPLKDNSVPKPDITASIPNNNELADTSEPIAFPKPDTLSSKAIVKQPEKHSDSLNIKTIAKTPVQSFRKNKWHVGLMVNGGISHVGSDFFGVLGLKSATASADQYNSGPGNQIAEPSKIKSSGAFIAGAFIEKAMSSKTKITVGLNYKTYNTSLFVGRNDSTALFEARNANTRYSNNFNFIELPVSLKVQLGKGKSPFYWQAGMSISGLISSNALQFNTVTEQYYKDHSLLSKTQIGLNTGLSASIFKIQNNPVITGPYFSYNTSPVAKEGLYNKQHFVFVGLRSEILFHKK